MSRFAVPESMQAAAKRIPKPIPRERGPDPQPSKSDEQFAVPSSMQNWGVRRLLKCQQGKLQLTLALILSELTTSTATADAAVVHKLCSYTCSYMCSSCVMLWRVNHSRCTQLHASRTCNGCGMPRHAPHMRHVACLPCCMCDRLAQSLRMVLALSGNRCRLTHLQSLQQQYKLVAKKGSPKLVLPVAAPTIWFQKTQQKQMQTDPMSQTVQNACTTVSASQTQRIP